MRAVPAVGIMKPASMRIVVDLPAPFGPRNPSTSPRATLKVTLSTAVKLPNRLVRPGDLDEHRLAVGSHAAPPPFSSGGGIAEFQGNASHRSRMKKA